MRRNTQRSRGNRSILKGLASIAVLFTLVGLASALMLPGKPPAPDTAAPPAAPPGRDPAASIGEASGATGRTATKGMETPALTAPNERSGSGHGVVADAGMGRLEADGDALFANQADYGAIERLPDNWTGRNYSHPANTGAGEAIDRQQNGLPASGFTSGFGASGQNALSGSESKRSDSSRSRRRTAGGDAPGAAFPGYGGAAPAPVEGAPADSPSTPPLAAQTPATGDAGGDLLLADPPAENPGDDSTDSDGAAAANLIVADGSEAAHPATGGADEPGSATEDVAPEEPVRIDGAGPVDGPLVVGPGLVIAPGESPGTLSIIGDFILEDGGLLEIEFAGAAPGLFDVLDIDGDALFEAGGKVEFHFIAGYIPLLDDSFEFLLADSISGFDWDNPDWLTLSIIGLPTDLWFTIDHTQASDGRDALAFRVIPAATGSGQAAAVPEPATLLLIALGLAGLILRQGRRPARAPGLLRIPENRRL